MRIPQAIGGTGVGVNMTPMIDVVFQLIIFFLVSSHLVQQESQFELSLPQATTAQEEDFDEKPRLTINVLADGRLLHGGREVTPLELQSQLQQRQKDFGVDVEVRIRCDRAVAYRHVEPVMLACVRCGLWNVTFAAIRSEEQQ